MNKTKSTIASILAIALVSVVSFGGNTHVAHANPMYFTPTAQTATATSSPVFMTPGTATSTIIYDSNVTARPNIAIDQALLLTQVQASSTATKYNIALEYSQGVSGVDCTATPTACDWYQDNALQLTNATTSQPFTITLPNAYTWTYASTTQGGTAVLSNSNRGLKAITIPILARYTRVIYSITGTNGSVWGQIVPVRQSF